MGRQSLFSCRLGFEGFVLIVDYSNNGPYRTVTNDAENVVREIIKANPGAGGRIFIYMDTQGIWDQLLVKDGEFDGFRSLNCKTAEEAMTKAKHSLLGATSPG